MSRSHLLRHTINCKVPMNFEHRILIGEIHKDLFNKMTDFTAEQTANEDMIQIVGYRIKPDENPEGNKCE